MLADKQQSDKTSCMVHERLRNAEQQLKKGFSLAANDRTHGQSKKVGALFVVNELFKIYFKLNTIRLCRNLIRAVESPVFPDLKLCCKRDTVTYSLYVGRIAMFEDDYVKAKSSLDFAARHCHKDYRKNLRWAIVCV